MGGQVTPAGEALPAGLARVRLLARVGPHVPLQLGRLDEAFAAGAAGEGLPRVSSDVVLQTTAKGKTSSACLAGKWPLACVDPLVRR